MIIDTHGHISLCPEVLAYKAQITASLGNPDVGPPKIPDARLREFGEKHLALLDGVGTDIQLLSPRPFHAMHSLRPHKVVVEWTRFVNEIIHRTCEMFPDRYFGVAGLPQATGEPLDTAIAELEHAVRDYGFLGCVINPDPSEGGFPIPPGLGDPYWYPLYEKMCELDIPALIHSRVMLLSDRESYTLHFINEESTAVVSLLESEVFTEFPDLKIQVGHGGGAIPYQIARFESWRSKTDAEERFRDSMRRLWFDTCVYNAEGLDLLFKIVGTDRCAFGTELPGTGSSPDRDTGRQFDDLRPVIENDIPWLTDEDKQLIFEGVPRTLFKLSGQFMSTGSATAARLIALDTPTLSDALDSLGLPCGFGGIVPFGPRRRIAGQAHTVKLITDDGQARARHLCTSAIEASTAGSVIVVEHHDRDDAAGWGGLLTAAAIEAGVSGVIVDGACRDVDDYMDLDFPVYAPNAVPTTARTRVVESETDTPILIGGRSVTPGDWVVADRSGLVVIELSAVADVVSAAERIKQREELMVADLRGGARVTEVLGRDYETMLTANATASRGGVR